MQIPTLLRHQDALKQTWSQLYGASLALALAELCQEKSGQKLIIAPDNLTTLALMDEIAFFLPEERKAHLLLFPDWETLPYDQFSPHQDLISERLKTLSHLQHQKNAIVLTSMTTLMHRLCPSTFIIKHGLSIEIGQTLNISTYRLMLEQAGYHATNKVLEHGEFAIRGSIVDLFPMGSKMPFRIELFDDEVDSIRKFDPETQRTIDNIKSIHILPAREYALNDESITLFRRQFREKFKGNPSLCPIYESISEGQSISGIEYYLPLFFETTATLFDYLQADAQVVVVDNGVDKAEQFWQEINHRYEQRNIDITRPVLPPKEIFIAPTDIFENANRFHQIRAYSQAVEKKGILVSYPVTPMPALPSDRHHDYPLEKLSHYLNTNAYHHLIVVESAGRREVMLELLRAHNITPPLFEDWQAFMTNKPPVGMVIGSLREGALLQGLGVAIITETELFGQTPITPKRSTQKAIDPDLIIRSLAELQVDMPVVHLQFGIGRYKGLQYIETNNITNEFLVLSYAGDDKIYVPVTSLHLISRYTGSDREHAPLHRLGSDEWSRQKKKAQEKITDVAVELLELYAKRQAKPGHRYSLPKEEYRRFAAQFSFAETTDQLSAIEAIIRDLESDKPMDRLICGDVGFGKTEVAMRAAFIAALNHRQVCVLVPTTLLAGQHFESFRDRFADFPIQIELLSRFRSAKESQKVMDNLENGKVDIVIATHKILQKNIQFKNLGLLIIDEEHRFGVKQKEAIKALRNEVDILSMTATPIPRTLNFAMAGIRDISLITTPPAKRLAVKTFWIEHQNFTLQEAILREILRGGQVYYLHNDVSTIHQVKESLGQLVPEAKIEIAHGQMKERELERVMNDFYHHRFNVLVSTTIIETGIDIPTANTIIIDRADKFGLAQLHQLRGRVGRSHHQAYAYLITPNPKLLTKDAIKRLEALVSYEDLGAGFILATHDMEIRGAGDFLGEEQSGNMHAIGFSLYMEMLDKAVQDLKSGKNPDLNKPLHQGPEIDLRISAILPDLYINDIHTRLMTYKRIANAKDTDELKDLQVEMIDRFGLLPEPVKHLFLITDLKLSCQGVGIEKIQANQHVAKIEFNANPQIDSMKLIKLLQTESKRYKMEGPDKIQLTFEANQPPSERILTLKQFIRQIQFT